MDKTQELLFLVRRDGFKCNRCDKSFGNFQTFGERGFRKMDYGIHVDHVLPSSLGYRFPELRDYIESLENKQQLCRVCHPKKTHDFDIPLKRKLIRIEDIISFMRDRKDLFKDGFFKEGCDLDILDQQRVRKDVKESGLSEKDFAQYFAYKNGRLSPNEQDFFCCKEIIDYINFDFKNR